MRRTRRRNKDNFQVDLILGADWHFRDDVPRCRVDNFEDAQWSKVEQIKSLQKKFGCPVLHAGDLFHHWKPSPYLISKAIQHLPKNFHTIYGQHDLPQHSMQLAHKSGIYALEKAQAVHVVSGSWGHDGPGTVFRIPYSKGERVVGAWHKFVWDGKKIPWPGCDELTAREILRKYTQFDLIVTGDHHKPFTAEYRSRLLVNSGCLTRQDASYINHKPRVYLYNAERNAVKVYYLEVDSSSVTRAHLDEKKDRENRLSAFVNRLEEDWEVSVSFEDNIKQALRDENIPKKVKNIVLQSIDDET